MQPAAARRRATIMASAAVLFIVLTLTAMLVYPGGSYYEPHAPRYQFFGNFFSDLGATVAWSGEPNPIACTLFVIALVTVGFALVGFAGAWRAYAFGQQRGRGAGIASQIVGVLSGLCFAGIGLTPFNRYLDAHNAFVLCAFGTLLIYTACITVLLWQNRAGALRIGLNLAYLALVGAYVALVVAGPRLTTPDGYAVQVTGQKIIVYASMIHIIFMTRSMRYTKDHAPVPGAPPARPRSG